MTLVPCVWTSHLDWFPFEEAEDEEVKCRFCGSLGGDGHLFGDCFSTGLRGWELSVFLPLMSRDRSKCPVVCCGMALLHLCSLKKATRPHVRAHRPTSFSSVPVSEGIEIRHECRFIRSLVRALGKLLCGIGGFLSCSVGSHISRLRQEGWEQCSHRLTQNFPGL